MATFRSSLLFLRYLRSWRFLLFGGMLILLGFLIRRAIKRRSYDATRGQQMHKAANDLSFAFQSQAELATLPFFAGFELFEGDPLKFENLLSGKIDGRDAMIFDLVYRNVASGGSGATTSRQTMAAISSIDLDLPEFHLRPEGTMEKVLSGVSNVDIDFPERPNFSKMFLLYGKDAPSIRRMFTAPRLDFFEKNPGLCVSRSRGTLFLYNSRTLAQPAQLGQYLAFLKYLNQLFSR